MSKPDLENEVARNTRAIDLLMGWVVRLEDQIDGQLSAPPVSAKTSSLKDRMLARQAQDFREFDASKSGQVRVSPAYGDEPDRARIFSMKMELSDWSKIMETKAHKITDICHLDTSQGDLIEVKAIRMEDEGGLERVVIQRWDSCGDVPKTTSMTFLEEEISQLLAFLISGFHARYAPEKSGNTDLERVLTRACKSLENDNG